MAERARWRIVADAISRRALWRFASSTGNVHISEFPKSGGSWLGQILGRVLSLPFPRNEFPAFFEPQILHGHHLPSDRFSRVIGMVRDGRDVVVSLYFHRFFPSDRNHPRDVRRHRKLLPFEDFRSVEENLPWFIEWLFTRAPAESHPSFTWSEWVRCWLEAEFPLVRYESLHRDPIETVSRAVEELGFPKPERDAVERAVAEFDFTRQSGGREQGDEDVGSFLRKGIVGDWRNRFGRRAEECFMHFAGDELRALGYLEEEPGGGRS